LGIVQATPKKKSGRSGALPVKLEKHYLLKNQVIPVAACRSGIPMTAFVFTIITNRFSSQGIQLSILIENYN
jgi:hypothetical protein